MPSGSAQVRPQARRSHRHPLARSDRRRTRLGHRGRGRVDQECLVRRAPLLRLARDQGVQDAHPGAALTLSLLHRMQRLPRRPPQARSAAVAGRRHQYPRNDALADRRLPPVFRRAGIAGAARPGRRPAAIGNTCAPAVLDRGRPGLSQPRPPVAHPVRRRSTADQPHHRARHFTGQHALRAGRALHRPASARRRPHRRRDAALARRRQHVGRSRARSEGDRGRGSCPRHRARARRTRRRNRVLRAGRGTRQGQGIAHRRLSTAPQAGRDTASSAAREQCRHLAAAGRRRAQPEGYRRRDSAAPLGLRHRRQRLGQVHPGARHRVSGAAARQGQAHRESRPPPRTRGRRIHRRCGHGRSEPNRPHDTLESRELCRRFRRDSRLVRPPAAGARAQIQRRHLQFQRRQRPLSGMRRQRLRARGDAVSLRCLPTLSRLRWPALSGGSPRGAVDARRCAADADVFLRLAPLADVVLDYLRLGQPVPTLSGGESQRLKLAGHLAENAVRVQASKKAAAKATAQKTAVRATAQKATLAATGTPNRRGSLFLFDEPTTGLHFDDVAKLLRAFRRLIDAGHSLLVIEHNLDVVRAADWIIDLGPEGGGAGGSVVCVGTPAAVMRAAASHTGRALLDADNPPSFGSADGAGDLDAGNAVRDAGGAPYGAQAIARTKDGLVLRAGLPTSIEIRGAREHNLKNVDVNLGLNKFTVITGVSGSGKSTLAFDILFAEGQRRYLESLNAYARQFVQPASRPDVDAIFGIPPTVAIEQRTSRGGHKSTVATLTEIYHFLRLMYVKLGVQYCPVCEARIEPQSADAIAARLLKDYRGESITLLAPLIVARKGLYTALAKWARGKGFTHLQVDGTLLPTAKWPRLDRFIEHNIELPVATLTVSAAREAELRQALDSALEHGRGVVHVAPGSDAAAVSVFSTKRACPNCGTVFPELGPRLFSFNSKHGWCKSCFGTGLQLEAFDAEQSGEESPWREADGAQAEDGRPVACADCAGQRLNPVAMHVLFRGQSI